MIGWTLSFEDVPVLTLLEQSGDGPADVGLCGRLLFSNAEDDLVCPRPITGLVDLALIGV